MEFFENDTGMINLRDVCDVGDMQSNEPNETFTGDVDEDG